MIDFDEFPAHERAVYRAIIATEALRRSPDDAALLTRGTLSLILTCLIGETIQNLAYEGKSIRDFDPKEASEEQVKEALSEFGIRLGRWTTKTSAE